MKDTDDQPDERYLGGGVQGGSQAQKLLLPCSWGASPSPCGWVHKPGSSANTPLWGFYGDFIT